LLFEAYGARSPLDVHAHTSFCLDPYVSFHYSVVSPRFKAGPAGTPALLGDGAKRNKSDNAARKIGGEQAFAKMEAAHLHLGRPKNGGHSRRR